MTTDGGRALPAGIYGSNGPLPDMGKRRSNQVRRDARRNRHAHSILGEPQLEAALTPRGRALRRPASTDRRGVRGGTGETFSILRS